MAIFENGVAGILDKIITWIINPLIWLVILIVVVGFTLLFLNIRKKRRLKFPVLLTTEYGDYNIKAGYFGIKSYLRGLWWTGREVMKTDEGDQVVGFTEDHFCEIDNKRGFKAYRDPSTNTIVPLNNTRVQGKELLMDIPPGHYVDEAVAILEEVNAETADRTEKIIQFVAWALVIVFSMISIIIIVQMVKGGQEEASQLILNAGGVCAEMGKQACEAVCTAIESTTAP